MPDHQPKIMVVDDDIGMRLTLEGIIEDEGYDVFGAMEFVNFLRPGFDDGD